MSFRLATFNVENLLTRFDFEGWKNGLQRDRSLSLFEIKDQTQYQLMETARLVATADDVRQQTALAIADTEADIICLQEVEGEAALNAFEAGYLTRMIGFGYPFKHMSNGNDTRGIDVGAMFRSQTADGEAIELVKITSHAALTYADLDLFTDDLAKRDLKPTDRIFKRDCMEMHLSIGGRPLVLFITHMKSMGGGRDGMNGRDFTMPVRIAEAKAIRNIVGNTFGGETASKHADFAICGDFNDYQSKIVVGGNKKSGFTFTPESEPVSALNMLVADGFAVNVLERLEPLERWTTYHSRGPDERHLCQLDYILLSPALTAKNPEAKPDIIREGQPFRAIAPDGQIGARYPRIGWDRPKASDHCPVAVTLKL
jgi:endonuclease/exonuclease/phosphatase family metal-dependent hydrolase